MCVWSQQHTAETVTAGCVRAAGETAVAVLVEGSHAVRQIRALQSSRCCAEVDGDWCAEMEGDECLEQRLGGAERTAGGSLQLCKRWPSRGQLKGLSAQLCVAGGRASPGSCCVVLQNSTLYSWAKTVPHSQVKTVPQADG